MMKQTTYKTMIAIKRHILLLVLVIYAGLTVGAQNSIDRYVDKLSGRGVVSVTSIVERDPKTRRVVKVIKTVKVIDRSAIEAWDLFDKEADSGTVIESRQDGQYTRILAVQDGKTSRIYKIKASVPKSSVFEITIIVNCGR